MGKYVALLGAVLLLVGLILWAGERLTGRSGGLLPGDIHIQRDNVHIYFPIVTSLVLSLVLSFVFWLFSRGRP